MPGITDNTGTLQQLLGQEMQGLQQPQGGGLGDALGGIGQALMMSSMMKRRGSGRGQGGQMMQLLMNQQMNQQKQQGNERNQKLDNVRQLVGSIAQIEQTNALRQQQQQEATAKLGARIAEQQFYNGVMKRGGMNAVLDMPTVLKIVNEDIDPKYAEYLDYEKNIRAMITQMNENRRMDQADRTAIETNRHNIANERHWGNLESIQRAGVENGRWNNQINQDRLTFTKAEAARKALSEGPSVWTVQTIDGEDKQVFWNFMSKEEMQYELPVRIAANEKAGIATRVIPAPVDKFEQQTKSKMVAQTEKDIDGIMDIVSKGKQMSPAMLRFVEANLDTFNKVLINRGMAPWDMERAKDTKYWLGQASAWFNNTTAPPPSGAPVGIRPRVGEREPGPTPSSPVPGTPVTPPSAPSTAAPGVSPPVAPSTSGVRKQKVGPSGQLLWKKVPDEKGVIRAVPIYEGE